MPDYIRFLDMAHGSAHELEYQIFSLVGLAILATSLPEHSPIWPSKSARF